jgi:predicted methyltransferase
MFAKENLAIIGAALVLVAAACTAPSTRQETTNELNRILAGEQRSTAERARDTYRHPKETLLFFGVRPEMNVLEVWPEPGWYTEILAPLLREHGRYTAAVIAPSPSSPYVTKRLTEYHDFLASHPELYDKVEVVTLPTDGSEVVPPNSLDMVVTFRNLHNWMAAADAPQVLASLYQALKPGGVLGIVEHRGNPAVPQDPKAKSGYVNEEYAVRLIEAQGFRLVAKSEINANPRDTRDYEQGVWTLPPTYRLGDKDREKYAAIGESDRFTMRFVKPAR